MVNQVTCPLWKRAHLVLTCLVLTGLFFVPSTTWAQQYGQITGRVMDADTREYLPGANVSLQGTGFGAATDRSGQFRIQNVPVGAYMLVASYIGYDAQSVDVTISERALTINQDITLKPTVVRLEGIQIYGLRQGQNKALNVQKTASNIMNVVAAEQITSFPDINSAEVLQRIPGISIQRDQGEGRYVQVRGTEARLNLMKVNGQEIPSPEADERSVMMDVIPADQLASIEVSKVITPDMDGNSIGGTVNLITKSALDFDKPVLNFTIGSGYADIDGKGYPGASLPGIYQAGLNYGTRLGEEQNIGIMLSGSLLRTDRGSENNELVWGNVKDVNGNTLPWALQDLQTRDYTFRRDRAGFSGSIDYKPSENSRFSLRGIYNVFDDTEIRSRLRARPSKGKYNSLTDVTGASMEFQQRNRGQQQTLTNVMGRGEHNLGMLMLDYSLSYSYGKEKQRFFYAPAFKLNSKVNFRLNTSDTDIPKYTITNLAAGYELQPENWELDVIEHQDYLTSNTDKSATLNLKVPYRLGGYQADLKVGGKMGLRNKDRNGTITEYSWEGSSDVLMSQFSGTTKVKDFLAGDYQFPVLPDPKKVEDFFKANKGGDLQGEIIHEETDGENYTANEDIYSFYAMTTVNIDNLMLLAGVRNELTKTKYTGNTVVYDADGDYLRTDPATAEKSYNTVLPMVHLRYRLTPETNLRAAFTTGIARANYYDLVPYKIVYGGDDEISMGNPDLKSTSSSGFDVLAEHYFQRIGILSGGFFYKSLKDIIYPNVYRQVGGVYDGFEVTQPVNGGDATLWGIELDWQQQLNFLPGFLDGLGIYANYTYTKSDADLPGRAGTTLPGQAGNVANFALSYQKYGFTAKVSVNYADKYIDAVGIDSNNDIYYDAHTQLDVTANLELFGGWSVYTQIINLTNAPLRYYIGDHARPLQREFYSWWVQAGVKFDLK